MIATIEVKKKFLVALSNPEDTHKAAAWIQNNVRGAQVMTAIDGKDAFLKIFNDPPNVAVLDNGLAKMKGVQILHDLVFDKRFKDVAFIVWAEIPETEEFVDAVVTGQLQFFHSKVDESCIDAIATKALNFSFKSLKNDFQIRFLSMGDYLIKQGEKATEVYLVKSGQLQAFLIDENKNTIELGRINAGEFVGEMSYINQSNRGASVVAITACEVIVIPLDHFDHLLFTKPSWAKALMQTLARRLQENNQKVN